MAKTAHANRERGSAGNSERGSASERERSNSERERDNSSDDFPHVLPRQHEIVRGMLVRKAMPSFEHGDAQYVLGVLLRSYHVSQGGRWWFAPECEIDLFPGERYLPDLAGWDSSRVAARPTGARVRMPPQWVCEILSPSTAERDRGPKQQTYHAAHVDHYWTLDPEARTLTVLGWAEDDYRVVLAAGPGGRVRAAPFEEIEIDLDALCGGRA